MHVLVLGGYGLIGLPVVLRLIEAGHRVTGLGRSVRVARTACPEAAWIERDIARLTRPRDWLPILAEVDAVVNCAGALQDSFRDNLQALQSDAIGALIEAARTARIGRIVQVSAVGVSPHATIPFLRTKAEADAALTASDLDWIILRPGLVIAPAAYGGTSLIRGLASFPFMIPLVGGTKTIQTVSADDVADAVLASAEGQVPSRMIYDLVEEKAHALEELVGAFRAWLGHAPAPVVRAPASMGRLICKLGDAASYLGWRPPLRTTALLQLQAGVIGDPSAWLQLRGRHLSSMSQTLRRRPAGVQERWFGRLFLIKPPIVVVLALFWLVSGVIGLLELQAGSAMLLERGMGQESAMLAVVVGSVLDIALAAMLLVRSTHKVGALGTITATLLYLLAGSLLTPETWLDPLGPFVKAIPAAMLACVALAVADER